jgi:hypothetical protein
VSRGVGVVTGEDILEQTYGCVRGSEVTSLWVKGKQGICQAFEA